MVQDGLSLLEKMLYRILYFSLVFSVVLGFSCYSSALNKND